MTRPAPVHTHTAFEQGPWHRRARAAAGAATRSRGRLAPRRRRQRGQVRRALVHVLGRHAVHDVGLHRVQRLGPNRGSERAAAASRARGRPLRSLPLLEHKKRLPWARQGRSAHRPLHLLPVPARPDNSPKTSARRQAGAAGSRAGHGTSAAHLLNALHGLQAAVGARHGRRGRRRRRTRLGRHVVQHRQRKQPKHSLGYILMLKRPEHQCAATA